MTLYDLKKVFKNGVDMTDNRWDMVVYAVIDSVDDRIAKMFNVIDIDIERVAPLKIDFDGFLKKHRAFMNKYIKLLYTEEYTEELINLSHDDFCEVVLCGTDIMHDFMNDNYKTVEEALQD